MIGLNPHDRPLVEPCLSRGARYLDLPPFLEIADAPPPVHRPDRPPELLAVGMMRPGDKLASYRVLGAALATVTGDWRLTVVGDGPARGEVEAALAPVADRVVWRGEVGLEGGADVWGEGDHVVLAGRDRGLGSHPP